MITQYEENDEYQEPQELEDFDSQNIRGYLNSKKLFSLLRKTVRDIYKETYKDPAVSKAFLDVEKIFNHIEYHNRLTK